MRTRSLAFLTTLAALLLTASAAAAHPMAGLEITIGDGVDALVRSDIEQAIPATFDEHADWSYIPAHQARAKLNPIVRDCFTNDCLQKAGRSTDADAGLRLQFSGEAQIYDWSIEIYDLSTGKLVTEKKGACELCGRSEVERTLKRSLKDALRSTPLPKKKVAKKTPPQPQTKEKTTPPKTADETTTPPTPSPGDAAGRVELEIRVVPDDARVLLSGEKIGTGNTTVELSPGTYELQFQREGFQGFKETVIIDENTDQNLLMRIHLSRTDPEAVPVAGSTGVIDDMGASKRSTYGLISMAAGGGALLSGMYLAAIDGESACTSGEFTDCPEIYDTGAAAITTSVVGTTLIAGGLVLMTWDALAGGEVEESTDNDEDTAVRVAPSVTAAGAGLGLFGRF